MPARFTGFSLANVALALCLCLSGVLVACGGGSHRASVTPGSMPQGGTFTGVWFSPQYGEMHLVQNGATVVGRFQKEERTGRIQGGVEGDLMRFEWTEARELIVGRPTNTKGRGYFRLVKDEREDNWKLVGEWGSDTYETGGGPWNAVKSKTRQPELGSGSGDESEADDSSDESSSDSEESNSGGNDGLGDL